MGDTSPLSGKNPSIDYSSESYLSSEISSESESELVLEGSQREAVSKALSSDQRIEVMTSDDRRETRYQFLQGGKTSYGSSSQNTANLNNRTIAQVEPQISVLRSVTSEKLGSGISHKPELEGERARDHTIERTKRTCKTLEIDRSHFERTKSLLSTVRDYETDLERISTAASSISELLANKQYFLNKEGFQNPLLLEKRNRLLARLLDFDRFHSHLSDLRESLEGNFNIEEVEKEKREEKVVLGKQVIHDLVKLKLLLLRLPKKRENLCSFFPEHLSELLKEIPQTSESSEKLKLSKEEENQCEGFLSALKDDIDSAQKGDGSGVKAHSTYFLFLINQLADQVEQIREHLRPHQKEARYDKAEAVYNYAKGLVLEEREELGNHSMSLAYSMMWDFYDESDPLVKAFDQLSSDLLPLKIALEVIEGFRIEEASSYRANTEEQNIAWRDLKMQSFGTHKHLEMFERAFDFFIENHSSEFSEFREEAALFRKIQESLRYNYDAIYPKRHTVVNPPKGEIGDLDTDLGKMGIKG